jgi:YHS domain-containing protein
MERAAEPVFIFLPVREQADPSGACVDPVCGRAISTDDSAGRLLYDGCHHYFCSLACAESFAADPVRFGPQ